MQVEDEELEEFELLEEAAANASFSSNSSVVVKVLAKARSNALGGKSVIQGQSGINNRGTEYFPILNKQFPGCFEPHSDCKSEAWCTSLVIKKNSFTSHANKTYYCTFKQLCTWACFEKEDKLNFQKV